MRQKIAELAPIEVSARRLQALEMVGDEDGADVDDADDGAAPTPEQPTLLALPDSGAAGTGTRA